MPFSSTQQKEQEPIQYFTQNPKSNYKAPIQETHDLVPPVTSGKKPPLSQPSQQI